MDRGVQVWERGMRATYVNRGKGQGYIDPKVTAHVSDIILHIILLIYTYSG